MAKGYRGARSKQYRVAKQSVMRALTSSYAGRKERKRQFRQLWIARINAAARINGLSYSKFMYGLKLAGVDLNRKVLSDMAINDAEGFAKLAELAKSQTGINYQGYQEQKRDRRQSTEVVQAVFFLRLSAENITEVDRNPLFYKSLLYLP